jgi:prepilin-type N-terminal cleavage/methylation domain-containing protein
MDSISKSKSKAGFTLAEILLAMTVFAIAISTILALLARSIETADSILIKDEAIGLSSAVDSFMNEQAFATVYEDVLSGKGLFAYHYRANPGSTRADGTLTSYPTIQATDQLGVNYVVVSGVRADAVTPELTADAAALEGRLFYVKLSVSEANPFGTSLPANPDTVVSGVPAYNSAVLVIFAEFFLVPTTVAPTGNPTPVFSFNFAVRR